MFIISSLILISNLSKTILNTKYIKNKLFVECKYTIVIFQSDENFQFPSGMKIVGDKIWAVSSQLQNQFTTIHTNRKSIKYRVLAGYIDELIKGTGCDKRSAPPVQSYIPSLQKLTSR